MHPALTQTNHRPWPLPNRPWLFRQSWRDLLFMHWPIAASALRPPIPDQLTIQQFDGAAWLGVVPFRMTDVTARFLPSIPGISAFPELNVRTYVEYKGVPGVWFFSLDASNSIAVKIAQRFFHLPYVHATMTCRAEGDAVAFHSERTDPKAAKARFIARYEPTAPAQLALPGSLDHFLTERYCLYAQTPRGRLMRGEVHHGPWPLQPARIDVESNELPGVHGLIVDDPAHPPVVHFARRVDVVLWPFESADDTTISPITAT